MKSLDSLVFLHQENLCSGIAGLADMGSESLAPVVETSENRSEICYIKLAFLHYFLGGNFLNCFNNFDV